MVDRAAILSGIWTRNDLRREAHLPRLPIRETYDRELRQALWQEHVEQYGAMVRAEVLADHRARFGPDFPQSGGGRMALNALTWKALRESFEAKWPPNHRPEHRPRDC